MFKLDLNNQEALEGARKAKEKIQDYDCESHTALAIKLTMMQIRKVTSSMLLTPNQYVLNNSHRTVGNGIDIWFLLMILLGISLMAGCSRQSTDTILEQYQYDNEGRLISKITPDGSKIKYKHNDQGLPIEIEYPDDSVRYGYDGEGFIYDVMPYKS